MCQTQSEKKFFEFYKNISLSIDCTTGYVYNYQNYFKAHRFNNTSTALNYIKGLLFCPKGQANMERMEEEIDNSEYRAYQHFISNSNWDNFGLRKALSLDSSKLLSAQKKQTAKPTGYIIDESAHLKKGKKSVGVSRQYAGVIGKVENSQVGVYCSLVNGSDATIINERIFLPEKWIEDPERCAEAAIPKENQVFKTKPQLALDMLKEDIENGVEFDWIGGDGLYGHNSELCEGIDELDKLFVLDVHKDETVYLEEPSFSVPERKSKKGRAPSKLKANTKAIRLDSLMEKVSKENWIRVDVRDSTSGILRRDVYKQEVWSWNGKEEKARKRTVIITKTIAEVPVVKYSYSNGNIDEFTHQEYAYFVCQRYWVERTFDDAKNELGMSDYQVRKWKSWHNHHVMIMMASLFIMKQKIENKVQVPLLSFRDARILVILQIFGTPEDIKKRLLQMEKRHKKRKDDILQKYKKQAENQKVLT